MIAGRQSMARLPRSPQRILDRSFREVGINHQAGFLAGTIHFEECFAGRIVLDAPAIILRRGANGHAQIAVVIHHIDDERPVISPPAVCGEMPGSTHGHSRF